MPTNLPAFIVTAFLLAMLPGAGQALMLRQVLTRGRRAAWTSIAGTATGLMLWSTLAAAGLSAALLANPRSYLLLRVCGAFVLFVLGANSWRSIAGHGVGNARVVPAARGAYFAGLLTNLGNPKAGVFAISLIPQFITPSGHVFASSVLLGATWAGTTAAWYLLFVWAVERGREFMSGPRVTFWLQAITGTVLMALGVAVVLA